MFSFAITLMFFCCQVAGVKWGQNTNTGKVNIDICFGSTYMQFALT